MKLNILISTTIAAILCSVSAYSETFVLDTAHTTVGFSVKHLMLTTVNGRFNKFDGSFDFDTKSGKLSDVKVSIDPKSIDTNQSKRDEHLKGADFFDVDKFQEIQFKSTKVDYKKNKPTQVMGDLTIRGITKPITLKASYEGSVKDPWGKTKVVFSLSGKINRKDFGLTWNKALESGGVLVGEDIGIQINSEADAKAN